MTKIIKVIWSSNKRLLVIFLTFITFYGLYLYFDRPSVTDKNDLIKIEGTLDNIDHILIHYGKLKKSSRDSTILFHLKEYPSKFQVSYFPYDKKRILKETSSRDKITFHISKEDSIRLYENNARIRSFSLTINEQVIVPVESGILGFGNGYFELILVIISLLINVIVIGGIIKKKAPNTR